MTYYGIENGDTIYMLLFLRGGGSYNFVDFDTTPKEYELSSSSENIHLSINDGLNMHGFCKNSNCKCCYKQVICLIGIGNYDLLKIVSYCPMCKQSIKPFTCGFYNCSYSIKYKKTNETIEKTQEKHTKKDKYMFYELNNGSGHLANYDFLQIKTSQL